MHPAASIVFFTSLSGAGFGLLVLHGVLVPAGLLATGRWFGATIILIALALTVDGLASSTFHLLRPGRAIHAFSQWRSSWLSREAVAAVATMLAATAYLGASVLLEHSRARNAVLGSLAGVGALMSAPTPARLPR